MPCNSEHLNPNDYEVEYSKALCVQDEIEGRAVRREWWHGYHPRAYNKHITQKMMDEITALACANMQLVDPTDFSLETQMWWRDHQAADKAKLEQRVNVIQRNADRKKALGKLTPYERELLGLDE